MLIVIRKHMALWERLRYFSSPTLSPRNHKLESFQSPRSFRFGVVSRPLPELRASAPGTPTEPGPKTGRRRTDSAAAPRGSRSSTRSRTPRSRSGCRGSSKTSTSEIRVTEKIRNRRCPPPDRKCSAIVRCVDEAATIAISRRAAPFRWVRPTHPRCRCRRLHRRRRLLHLLHFVPPIIFFRWFHFPGS